MRKYAVKELRKYVLNKECLSPLNPSKYAPVSDCHLIMLTLNIISFGEQTLTVMKTVFISETGPTFQMKTPSFSHEQMVPSSSCSHESNTHRFTVMTRYLMALEIVKHLLKQKL